MALVGTTNSTASTSTKAEQGTHKRISEVIAEEIPAEKRQGIVVLSGPSHAEEVHSVC
jgi:glycerol-3-phosphate dehydrogenase